MSKPKPPVINPDDYIIVKADELWLHNKIGRRVIDDSYYRIIDFYAIHSPCKDSSYTPLTLESLGWKNPWHSSKFRKAFDDVPGFNKDNYKFHDSNNHFKEKWEELGIPDFFAEEGKEFAAFIYAGESNDRMDLLHHIRNSISHGRYTVKTINQEPFFYFEDVTTISKVPGLVVNARICLKKTTLIEWLDIFEFKSSKSTDLASLYILSK